MEKWILFCCSLLSVYTTFGLANEVGNHYDDWLQFCYNKKTPRFFLFPSEKTGELHYIDLQEPPNYELIEFLLNTTEISFNLFTRHNREQAQLLYINDEETLNKSYFNKNVKTVITSHGWLGDKNTEMNIRIKAALLQRDDLNVIVLDWSSLAKTFYPTAVAAVPEVGKKVGKFINWLTTTGVSYDSIHLVGFSLGGHVVGCAGKEAHSNVSRITALDPAGPLFIFPPNPNTISKQDGRYVEVIHTCGVWGMCTSLGHADYYPNGGEHQPHCPSKEYVIDCSHHRAWQLFQSSIELEHQFQGHKCVSLIEAIFVHCHGEVSLMGYTDLSKKKFGIFGLKTTGVYPYV